MSKNFAIAILIGLLAISCSPLRHYKKVAKDQPRDKAKRELLAPVCAIEFPVIASKTETKIDTIYAPVDTGAISTLKITVRQLLRQLQQRPECPQINEDSLIDAVKSTIKPQVKTVHHYTTETVLDSAAMVVAQTKYSNLLNQYEDSLKAFDNLRKDHKQLVNNTKSNRWLIKQFLKLNWWWLLLVAGATTALIILFRKARLI